MPRNFTLSRIFEIKRTVSRYSWEFLDKKYAYCVSKKSFPIFLVNSQYRNEDLCEIQYLKSKWYYLSKKSLPILYCNSLYNFGQNFLDIQCGYWRVEEVRAEHVKLSWEAPDDDGGTPVVRYLIKIMDLDYSQWINAAEVKPWHWDGSSDQVAHAWRKMGLFRKKYSICDCSQSNQMP